MEVTSELFSTGPTPAHNHYDSASFIAAQLLHLIESSIARKVVVHSNTDDGLLCWIFNPDIYYSSSKRGPTVYRAMKSLLQTCP